MKQTKSRFRFQPFALTNRSGKEDDAGVAAKSQVPALLCDAIVGASPEQRVPVLRRLLSCLGPLALTVVAGGAFAKCAARTRWTAIVVSVEDAAIATWTQIFEVVRYAEQANPHLVRQLLAMQFPGVAF